MTKDLTKRYKVEEGLIKESTGSNYWSGKCHSEWIWSTYKIHASFDTYEEAKVLLEELNKRPAGYTHYRITEKLFSDIMNFYI